MKKMTILLTTAFCQLIQAQSKLPDYYVYMITGEATLSKNGAKPVAVKQNQFVFKTDLIVLKKGAKITLGDKDGKFLELKAEGNYHGIDLVRKAQTRVSDGITVKYARILYHELLDPSHDFEKFRKDNLTGKWGGVSRGDECQNMIFPIKGLKTSASSIVFKWHRTSPSSNYAFFIYDGEGKELAKMSIKDTLQPVNVTETLLGKPGKYFWSVISDDGTCEDEIPIYFHLMSPEKENEQIEMLLTGTGNESLQAQLLQIDKLEKNGFIDAAAASYGDLAKANSADRALLKSYVLFLLQYGFDEEAASVWK